MKRINIIAMLMIFVIMLSTSAFAYSDPQEALEAYFEADKDEDIDAMLDLTDFSFITDEDEREDFIEQTERSMEELARIFDTISYTLDEIEVIEDDTDALVFYHLVAELEDIDGETATNDLHYVATMHNEGSGWKIATMQSRVGFDANKEFVEVTRAAGNNYGHLDEFEDEDDNGEGIDWWGVIVWILKLILKIIVWIFQAMFSIISGCIDGDDDHDHNDGGFFDDIKDAIEDAQDSSDDDYDQYHDDDYDSYYDDVDEPINSDDITAREATSAYQDYIAKYNALTDLMSQGKGDTPEATQAYTEYKEAKENYESIAQSLK